MTPEEFNAERLAGYPRISEPERGRQLRRDRCGECAGGILMCNASSAHCANRVDPADWPFPPPVVWEEPRKPLGLLAILCGNPDLSRRCDRIVYRVVWAVIALAAALVFGVVLVAMIGAVQ